MVLHFGFMLWEVLGIGTGHFLKYKFLTEVFEHDDGNPGGLGTH